jgi:uncharacterized phage protein (TIGR01671 family)
MPIEIKYQAVFKNREPNPGICKVISMDFETKIASITNGICRYLVNFDEVHFRKFTGPKDINGKEIYEGDILYELSFDGDAILCEVVFSNGAFMLKEGEITDSFLYDSAKDMEVIGNVYENPELLNKKV